MGTFTDNPVWVNEVYQLETSDPVLGGLAVIDNGEVLGGHSNVALQQLVNRTAYLRNQQANSSQNLIDHEQDPNPHPQYLLTSDLNANLPITGVSVFPPLTVEPEVGDPSVFTIAIPEVTQLSDGYMSATDKQKLDGLVAASQSGAVVSVNGETGVVTLTKSSLGLSNVDNTSDVNKPISTATQAALDGKIEEAPSDGGLYARQNENWVNISGDVLIQDLGAVGGTNGQIVDLNLTNTKFFSASLLSATNNPTWSLNFTFSNIPSSSSKVISWHVEILGGNKRTISFPNTVRWASGVQPTFNSERTVLMFYQMLNRSSVYGMMIDQGSIL